MAKVLPTGTDIQIATDAAFMSVVIDDEGGYKTSRSFTRGDLPYGVNLYARIRHTHPQAGTSYWSPTIKFKVITPASAIGVCLDNTDTTKKGVFYWIDAAGNKVDSFNFQNHPTYAGISMATLDADRAPVTMTKIPLFYIKTAAAGPVDSFAAGKKCWWLSDVPLPGFRPAACFKRSTETDANGKRVIAPYCYVGTYLGQQETVAGKNCIGSKKGQTIVSLPKATADQYIANRNVTDGKLYVEDVFSTYLYTGNNSTQTINNGIDLSGYGGLVWIKGRNSDGTYHHLFDTLRGASFYLKTNDTGSYSSNGAGTGVSSFLGSGFALSGNDGSNNTSNVNYASWTFRRAPKFFDIVTYTGDGTVNRQLPHDLGCEPGMIIIKCLDNPGAGNVYHWSVWHRSVPGKGAMLDMIDGFSSQTGYYCITGGDVSSFYVTNNPKVNFVSAKYVAYVFAHNADSDGLMQCGSVTNMAPGAMAQLGWEPQLVIVKRTDASDNWVIIDNGRGFSETANNNLHPNTPNAENGGVAGSAQITPTATGIRFNVTYSGTYIYLAIRRPNKPPKTGAEVFTPLKYTSDGTTGRTLQSGFPVDSVLYRTTNNALNWVMYDRLRGIRNYLLPSNTQAEEGMVDHVGFDLVDGIRVISTGNGQSWLNESPGALYTMNFFRRAPGFFDVVCYTGTGVARALPHGLGVAPELCITKSRGVHTGWLVGSPYIKRPGYPDQPAVAFLHLSDPSAQYFGLFTGNGSASDFTDTEIRFAGGSNVFGPDGNIIQPNTNGSTYVAYLFASLPGVSKVFSFTGNGTSLPVDCGFTSGARFVLIKRTDDTGDWFVWDNARGIALGNDPHLSLNSTAVEVTTDDAIDPWNSGFIVKQNTATNVNVSGGKYIGLAIA